MADSRVTGVVKWFNENKGYGFIAPEDGSKDVFVHITSLKASRIDDLAEGDTVEFEVGEGRSGKPQAVNLKVLAVKGA